MFLSAFHGNFGDHSALMQDRKRKRLSGYWPIWRHNASAKLLHYIVSPLIFEWVLSCCMLEHSYITLWTKEVLRGQDTQCHNLCFKYFTWKCKYLCLLDNMQPTRANIGSQWTRVRCNTNKTTDQHICYQHPLGVKTKKIVESENIKLTKEIIFAKPCTGTRHALG